MKVALREVAGRARICLARGDAWLDALACGRALGLAERAPREAAREDGPWTDNLLAVDGLWAYLGEVDAALAAAGPPPGAQVPADAPFLPPLPAAPLIFGLAGNNPMVWRKTAAPVPTYPVGYTRPWASLSGHGQTVTLGPEVTSFRCAVELGVVIGRRARNVSRERAMEHVAAYTVVNDMIGNQWKDFARERNPAGEPSFMELLVTSYYGRGSDGFCPMGPALVSREEVADPYGLFMWTRVNGQVRDRSHTNAMVVGIDTAIAYLSALFTLEPGSVIHMGTMGIDGVTLPADQPLGPADHVELEIEGLGALRTHFNDLRRP